MSDKAFALRDSAPTQPETDGDGRHSSGNRGKGHHETDEKDLLPYARHCEDRFRDAMVGPSGPQLEMRVLRPTQRSNDEIVADVAACVRAGGTVIFPTETVYGIGCDPDNVTAVAAIYRAKARGNDKPLALHVTDASQAAPFVARWSPLARSAIDAFWPGPVAIIVDRNPRRAQRAACSLATISLRCPDDALCQAILNATGPLAATSANVSGAPAFFGEDSGESDLPPADLAVLAGQTKLRAESTIVDCTSDAPVVLREGAVPAGVILSRLGTLRTAR